MKSSCLKQTTFFMTFICKHLVKNCNVYLAGSIWILLSISGLLILHQIANIDPGSNPKYVLLCNAILMAYSLTWGFASRKKKIIFYLPTFLLPFLAIMMEFANFTVNVRFYFFSQIFHFFLLDIAWFIFCNILHSISVSFKRMTKPFIYCQSLVEISTLWLMSSIIMNAFLNGGINDDAIVAICQTNTKEAWHYFWELNHGAILVLSMIIFFIIFVVFIYQCRKTSLKQQEPNLHLSRFSTLSILTLAIFLCCIGWIGNMYAYYMPLTYQTIHGIKYYHHRNEQFSQMVEARRQLLMQHIASHKGSQGVDGMFVLIIGESLDRRYMGCYNPQHKTTPFQNELKKLPNAFFFPKIFACHVQTTRAVPMILTANNQYIPNSNIDSSTNSALSLSLFDYAKSNGYSTLWISNQEKISSTNSIITSIAMSADQTIFIRENQHSDIFDDHEILSYLEKYNPTGHSLVIIHLNGNHAPYGTTFPADFKFPAGLSVYEKSVFYNDYVLQQLMDYFQSHGTMVVAYTSDHADAVTIGKGHDPRLNNFQKEMIEIPMWFWVSDEYRQQYPNIFAKLQASSNKVITNDLVFYMFMDLMQIPYIENAKYSPLSDDYILDTEPPKTLGGKIEIPNP